MAKAKDTTAAPGAAPKTRPAIDWEAVEADYRAGVLSLREMATAHGVSHVAIKKHADRDGWSRDLSAKIKAQADALVNRQAVTTQVNANAAVTERLIVEANAQRIAQVRGEHRADIQRTRTLALTMLAELEGQTANLDDLVDLGEKLRRENDNGVDRLNDLYQKIISTPGRVDALKKVAETLKHAIGLEREAYGLNEAGAGGGEKPDPIDWDAISPADRQAAFMRLIGA